MKLTGPIPVLFDDPAQERVRANHEQRIGELQALPAVNLKVIKAVLRNNVGELIPHGLGRKPLGIMLGPIDGASSVGMIQDFGLFTVGGQPNDLTRTLSLRAFGYGADIKVDIWVA